MIGGFSILTQGGRNKDDLKGPISKAKLSGRTRSITVIKKKVDSGRYRVEPKKVAEKMVEDAIRDLRSRGQ